MSLTVNSRFSCKRHPPKKNSGAALIMALLIVVMVSVLAVKFSESFNLNVARSENRWYGAQAKNYLLATESMAGYFLEKDANENEIDELSEAWNADLVMPTDEGLLEAKLEDAQGRYNLNGLSIKAKIPDKNVNPQLHEKFSAQQKRFIRLLQIFDEYPLTQDEAISITEAAIDWVDDDGDNVTGFGGAESLHYSNKKPSYQPANQFFDSVSELQMVKGVTPELYRLLEPLICVLPDAATTLNLNTASPQLLRTINRPDDLSPLQAADVATIIEERSLQPAETVNDFFSNPAIQSIIPVGAAAGGYGVSSDYFLMFAKTTVGEQIRFVISYLHRDPNKDGKVVTLNRRYTSY